MGIRVSHIGSNPLNMHGIIVWAGQVQLCPGSLLVLTDGLQFLLGKVLEGGQVSPLEGLSQGDVGID